MFATRTGSWSRPFWSASWCAATHRGLAPRKVSAGPFRDLDPGTAPPTVSSPKRGRSGAGAAELAPGVVELAVDLVLQEHDGRDDGQRDEGHEEAVLHHRGALLVLGELRLEPGTGDEQVHVILPLLRSPSRTPG